MIRSLLGIAPIPTGEDAYRPSHLAIKKATSSKTDYQEIDYEKITGVNPYEGLGKKVLMLCTEEKLLEMKNGKKFSTGNHPVEMFVPMLHLENAGFDIDIATPTGKSVKIEMWAMPDEDKHVRTIFSKYAEQLENPINLAEFVQKDMENSTDYVGVFIPGGHGALLGLHDDKNVGKLLRWVYEKDLYTMVICHGPAALLSLADKEGKDSFIYNGYEIVAFPDVADGLLPYIGYLPGKLPWKFGKKLNDLGISIVNVADNERCHVDRKLISGASPLAANKFGETIVKELLKTVQTFKDKTKVVPQDVVNTPKDKEGMPKPKNPIVQPQNENKPNFDKENKGKDNKSNYGFDEVH
ncbi:molecular chaperone Hsp31 and glyoxalase 3 [Balneicella halophila]|uniref:Molecular chaperone Hsp31 and glyoxalase 3 n=1 Tax=Balneicella halophila TaxID=1537566 RepID=A0A7L4UQ78_BALHA|nr:DJ-1/PfpI family protein [Balneicella halophila]PVX51935.1 molecular chaperone Hsp31 and glyoxalase 3 [Balneicella halophila]